jgi:hypothetical protein
MIREKINPGPYAGPIASPPMVRNNPDYAPPLRDDEDRRRNPNMQHNRARYELLVAAETIKVYIDMHPRLARWMFPKWVRDRFMDAADEYDRSIRESNRLTNAHRNDRAPR